MKSIAFTIESKENCEVEEVVDQAQEAATTQHHLVLGLHRIGIHILRPRLLQPQSTNTITVSTERLISLYTCITYDLITTIRGATTPRDSY